MAKSRTRLTHKSLFGVFAIFLSLVGLVAVSAAAQQRTNTQSDAKGIYGCGRDPEITLLNAKGEKTSVEYTLKLKNKDKHNPKSRNCYLDVYHITVDKPRTWHVSVKSEDYKNHVVEVEEGKSENIVINVSRPTNYKIKGVHDITVKATNQRHDDEKADGVKVLKYTVE